MKIKVYIINLARSPQRKKHITKQLKNCNIKHSFINAIDGLNKQQADFKTYNQNTINITGKELKPTEIGAFLSHIKAIKTAKKDGVDWAVILEDDIILSPDFNDIFNHIKTVDKMCDCIRMYVRGAGLSDKTTAIAKRNTYTNWGGALAYAINKSGINKVLAVCDNFTMKIDNFLFGFWQHSLKIYQTNKNLVAINQTINSDIGYHKNDKPKTKPLIRLIYKVKYKILSLIN